MKKIEFLVEGITCGGCIKKIEGGLAKFTEIEELEVSVMEKSVFVTGNDELSGMTLKSAIEELGFQVVSMKKT